MATAKKNLPQAGKFNKRRAAKRQGRTLNFRIDGFDEMEGPVMVSACTIPIEGQRGQILKNDEWVYGESFSMSLNTQQDFPISIRAHREPAVVGDKVVPKETGVLQLHRDPDTWTESNYIRGSEACNKRGFCIHERSTDYRCPRPISMPSGRITDADETWVLREDGPPVKESELEALRAKEADQDLEITAKADAKRGFWKDKPIMTPKTITNPHPLPAPNVMGGTGPATGAVGPRTGA